MDEERKKSTAAHWITLALVAVMVLFSAYVGSYVLIVEPTHATRFYPLIGVRQSADPRYHVFGKQDFWRAFFAPANSLDRRVRPKTWAFK